MLTADTYVVAGVADHISPWQACYRSARLLGSKELRFVLSTSGHIAALVNPPGNPKASYRVGTTDERDPDECAAVAELHRDSWWPDYAAWLAARGGEQKTATKKLGTRGLPPLEPAPGIYVHELCRHTPAPPDVILLGGDHAQPAQPNPSSRGL
jgi:poly(3-hydroxyalkanoate) synthetase